MGCRVTSVTKLPGDAGWHVTYREGDGSDHALKVQHVVSSTPLRELMRSLQPLASSETLRAVGSLRYRNFLTVALMARPSRPFSDNTIYIHEPNVKVGRVQNFGRRSPELVPDPDLACHGLEYFCFEGDGLWNAPDAELVALGTRELEQLGLVRHGDVLDAHVVRQPKAYPVYDDAYAANVEVIRRELTDSYAGLHLVGRNGMHKYNNQDHSMMTALLVARNILAGRELFDVWRVNQDAEYHEEVQETPDTSGRLVPKPLPETTSRSS
jgi:protoporphyrinogen oxidase